MKEAGYEKVFDTDGIDVLLGFVYAWDG
jgi:hypothetical protein